MSSRRKQEPDGPRAGNLVQQPLRGKDYAQFATIMGAGGLLLLVLFVYFIPKLLPAGFLYEFFYIVVIAWGLISAIVLFGVMRSYAHLRYNHPVGGVVELGGPAAFAALVVLGGMWLMLRHETFDLTVRPHGPDAPVVTSGKIRLELGRSALVVDLSPNGEADFKNIPHLFWGKEVKILPNIDGYKEAYQTKVLNTEVLDLDLQPPETKMIGRVVPAPRPGQHIAVLVQGERDSQSPDSYGRFSFVVHKKVGDKARFFVCADGWRVYDDYQSVGADEVEIRLRRPDLRCSQ
jgi:hypothetical protein